MGCGGSAAKGGADPKQESKPVESKDKYEDKEEKKEAEAEAPAAKKEEAKPVDKAAEKDMKEESIEAVPLTETKQAPDEAANKTVATKTETPKRQPSPRNLAPDGGGDADGERAQQQQQQQHPQIGGGTGQLAMRSASGAGQPGGREREGMSGKRLSQSTNATVNTNLTTNTLYPSSLPPSVDEEDPEEMVVRFLQRLREQAILDTRKYGLDNVKVTGIPIKSVEGPVELNSKDLQRIRKWADFMPPFEPIPALEVFSETGRQPREHMLRMNQELLEAYERDKGRVQQQLLAQQHQQGARPHPHGRQHRADGRGLDGKGDEQLQTSPPAAGAGGGSGLMPPQGMGDGMSKSLPSGTPHSQSAFARVSAMDESNQGSMQRVKASGQHQSGLVSPTSPADYQQNQQHGVEPPGQAWRPHPAASPHGGRPHHSQSQ